MMHTVPNATLAVTVICSNVRGIMYNLHNSRNVAVADAGAVKKKICDSNEEDGKLKESLVSSRCRKEMTVSSRLYVLCDIKRAC